MNAAPLRFDDATLTFDTPLMLSPPSCPLAPRLSSASQGHEGRAGCDQLRGGGDCLLEGVGVTPHARVDCKTERRQFVGHEEIANKHSIPRAGSGRSFPSRMFCHITESAGAAGERRLSENSKNLAGLFFWFAFDLYRGQGKRASARK